MEQLSKFWKQHTVLAIGGIVSIVLLSTFLVFQYHQTDILKLETRWLIVSGLPILVALIVGGYIKSFKGFGVELEAKLEKPVSTIGLVATKAMKKFDGDEKQSIEYLERLSDRERARINRLSIIQGKPNYYTSHALGLYLRGLGSLKYIEVKAKSGKFVCLIPIGEFKHNNEVDTYLLTEFIGFLERSELLVNYKDKVIVDSISEELGLIEALKVMKKKRVKELVVVDDDNYFMGVLTLRSVERKIINNVLQATRNA